MSKFAIIGVGGYIAPKHVRAVYGCGGELIAVHDLTDSVGFLDQYACNIPFYTELDEFASRLNEADYLVVCTPNYLHLEHIMLGFLHSCSVICEKPLVTKLDDLKMIREGEQKYNQRCWTILQSRVHPTMMNLKSSVEKEDEKLDVKLSYLTARGDWYFRSWKGNDEKSGTLVANIGIHLLDIMQWMFGPVDEFQIAERTAHNLVGKFETEKAMIDLLLSIKPMSNYPTEPIRTLTIGHQIYNLSEKFSQLHTILYKNILAGKGIGIDDAYPSLELVYRIINS